MNPEGITVAELADQLIQDTRWHRRAACRPSLLPPGMDSTWFIPPITAGDHNPEPWLPKGLAAALICRACPVRGECGEAGEGQVGIWGGRLKARDPWKTGKESSIRARERFHRHLEAADAP